MGATKKPRKTYRPKPVWVNPMAVVRENAAVLDPEQVARVVAVVRQAADLFRRGEDPAFQVDIMADALNIAESIAELGICSDDESVQAIAGAQRVLVAASVRADAGGTWTMRGDELRALDDGLDRHFIQLRFVSRSEYDRAIDRTQAKLSAALRGQGSRKPLVLAGGFARDPSRCVSREQDKKSGGTRDTRPQNAGQFG